MGSEVATALQVLLTLKEAEGRCEDSRAGEGSRAKIDRAATAMSLQSLPRNVHDTFYGEEFDYLAVHVGAQQGEVNAQV